MEKPKALTVYVGLIVANNRLGKGVERSGTDFPSPS